MESTQLNMTDQITFSLQDTDEDEALNVTLTDDQKDKLISHIEESNFLAQENSLEEEELYSFETLFNDYDWNTHITEKINHNFSISKSKLTSILQELVDYVDELTSGYPESCTPVYSYTDEEVEACIQSLKEEYGTDLVPGSVSVGFKGDILPEDMDEFSNEVGNDYCLQVDTYLAYLSGAIYKTPESEELKWACILQEDDRIEFAYPDYYMQLF